MANNSIGDVMSLIPVKSVERDHLVYQNNTYGMVIKVNSINLFLMTPEDVQLTVGRLAGVLKGINKQCSVDLFGRKSFSVNILQCIPLDIISVHSVVNVCQKTIF